MFTFMNLFSKSEEEKDYLERHKKGYVTAFLRLKEMMGTVSMVTNLKVSGEIVYDMLNSSLTFNR